LFVYSPLLDLSGSFRAQVLFSLSHERIRKLRHKELKPKAIIKLKVNAV
jgi:hypothetical protein